MITKPLPHQVNAIHEMVKALRLRGKCACFMFKGSGKSLIALSVAENLGMERILITSDKINAEVTWPDQIDRHTEGWEYVVRPHTKKDWAQIANAKGRLAVCVNYEYLTNKENLKRLVATNLSMWIGDESSEFKDQRTRKHRCLAHLIRHTPFRLILNGDPATENLEDLFGQFKMLDDGKRLGQSITEFRLRYMMPDRDGYHWIPKRGALTQIQEYVRDISYWCHYDPDVKLPTPHYMVIRVPQTEQQADLNRNLMFTFAAELEGCKIETNYAPVVFQKMVQVAGGVFRGNDADSEEVKDEWLPVPTKKIEVLKKLIKENPKAKIVVWHNYIPETELLFRSLIDWETPLIRAVPPFIQEGLKKFRNLKGGGVCLIRCSTCRGINELADADIAVFYSNPFSYARRAQAEGRSSRVSSLTEDTYIFDIITEGGADETVYNQIRNKRSFSLTLPVLRSILNEQHA